ncbi:hypothetical protein EC968_009468 [Mortierella alpina]|nr:hypothetical protein EC968_009468 [Mortierella alpina]
MASAPSTGLGLGLMGTGPSRPAQQIPSDPHFHQHLSSQQPPQQPLHYQHPPSHPHATNHAYPLPSPHGPGPHQFYGHDHHSRHSSSVGSLPDLQMSSSSAPSTTTTSSLSRADSLSTMEYLQGGSHGSYYGRRGGSATTGSSAGSSFGRSVTSRSGSTGSIGRSLQQHHSMGSIGRANLNAAVHQQRRPPQDAPSPAPSKSAASKAAGDGAAAGNSKTGSSSAGGSGTEQGRNSTKRAAQNRAAQRAFRQRKDLYVRDLERKADLWQQAEGTILKLEARNRELECALLIVKQSNQTLSSLPLSPSSQHSPLPHHPKGSPTAASVATTAPLTADRDRHGWESLERERAHDQRFPARRLALGRHASSHQLHHAYNSDSSSSTPTPINGSLKQLTISNRRHIQRPESDYEADGHERHVPHRPLHRHPSEPSLGLDRRQGSLSADSDDYFGSAGKPPIRSYYADPCDTVAARSGSIDSSGMESSHHSTSPNQFSPLAHPDHTTQQDRPPLHPVSAHGSMTAGAGAATLSDFPAPPVTKPWNSSPYPQEDDMKHSPSLAPIGGMVAAASPLGRPVAGAEMEYMSDDHRSKNGRGYDTPIKKRPSDGSLREWADTRRGGPHPLTPRSPVGLPPLSAFDMEMHDPHNHNQQQQRSQPPHPQYSQHRYLNHRGSASSLSGKDGGERRPSGSETSGGGHSRVMTTESPDLSSLSSESRFNSSSNTASMSTPGQAVNRHQQLYFSSLQQQHQQLAQQAQQQRAGLQSLHRQSPENEHLPGGMVGYGGSPHTQISHQHPRPGHQHEYNDSEEKYSRNYRPDPTGPEMNTFYDQQQQPLRANAGYHNEASMRSP